jgi:hypothetical protein
MPTDRADRRSGFVVILIGVLEIVVLVRVLVCVVLIRVLI